MHGYYCNVFTLAQQRECRPKCDSYNDLTLSFKRPLELINANVSILFSTLNRPESQTFVGVSKLRKLVVISVFIDDPYIVLLEHRKGNSDFRNCVHF